MPPPAKDRVLTGSIITATHNSQSIGATAGRIAARLSRMGDAGAQIEGLPISPFWSRRGPSQRGAKGSRMTEEKPLGAKLLRFMTVGVANTAIDFAIFALALKLGMPALAANFLAWLVAVTFSYLANANWSFDRKRRHSEALPRFIAMGALISLLVSSFAVGLMTGVVGLWPAKIGGTIAAAILNFLAARWSIENRLGR